MTKPIEEIKGLVGIAGSGKSDRLKRATYHAAVAYEKAENGEGNKMEALDNLLEVAGCEINQSRNCGRHGYADKLQTALQKLAMATR